MLGRAGDPAGPFVLGDAPFWPVDHVTARDGWVGHVPFAFWIVEALRPRLLVELGTQSGNSYLAFAQAVQRLGLDTACFAVDTAGRGDTHAGSDGEEGFQALSGYHDARYSAFSRLVRASFDEATQHFPDASVDLLHVLGGHTYEAVAREFQTWEPKLSPRAVVLFHDINVREGDFGVWRLWGELRSGHPHFEFLHAQGLGVLGVGSDLPAAVTSLMRTTPDAAGASRIREAFARLGSSVVERMRFQRGLETLQSEIDRLTQALTARDDLIRRGAEEKASREEDARARHESRVAQLEGQLQLINGLQHEIARLGALRESELIESQEHLLRAAVLQNEIDQVTWTLAARDEQIEGQLQVINELRREADTLRREADTLRREADTLRGSLTALHHSRSVRITRPLRQAGNWYRAVVAWARRGDSTR